MQRGIDEELAVARRRSRPSRSRSRPGARRFHRLVEKKGGLAIVKVVNGSCSACHMKVRPHAVQTLKVGLEIINCDSCKRILYWDGPRVTG